VMGLAIFRVANGKIAEVWGLRDHIGTMLQLGVTHQIA
jgi:predicted ester cyclase